MNHIDDFLTPCDVLFDVEDAALEDAIFAEVCHDDGDNAKLQALNIVAEIKSRIAAKHSAE